MVQVCERTSFHANTETYPQPETNYLQKHFGVWMTYEEKEVRQEITRVEYNAVNMLGDIGGIAGIMIGLSLHLISSVVAGFVYTWFMRKKSFPKLMKTPNPDPRVA